MERRRRACGGVGGDGRGSKAGGGDGREVEGTCVNEREWFWAMTVGLSAAAAMASARASGGDSGGGGCISVGGHDGVWVRTELAPRRRFRR